MTQTPEAARPSSRWQGGHYHPHETRRMLALEGVELASFARRSAALAIDFATVVVLFLAIALPVVVWQVKHEADLHLHFNPFENWYRTLLPVVYCGLSV